MLELITKLKFNAVTTFALQTKFANIIFICALQERSETLQTKHLMGSSYYNSRLFRYFRYKLFDVKFFIFENVIPLMPLSLSYQTRASFFWSTKYKQWKIRIYVVVNHIILRPKIHMFVT